MGCMRDCTTLSFAASLSQWPELCIRRNKGSQQKSPAHCAGDFCWWLLALLHWQPVPLAWANILRLRPDEAPLLALFQAVRRPAAGAADGEGGREQVRG